MVPSSTTPVRAPAESEDLDEQTGLPRPVIKAKLQEARESLDRGEGQDLDEFLAEFEAESDLLV